MNYAKEHLLYMLQKEAYTPGNFTLASGKETDFYIDCRKVTLTNTGMWLVGRLFCQEIAEIDPRIKAIAGEGIGGSAIALAASMAHSSFIQTILIRKQAKEHGTKSLLEGASNLSSCPVILVEDVVTSGASVIKAANTLKEAGFEIKSIICLVDRQEGGKENIEKAGFSVKSIFTKEDILN